MTDANLIYVEEPKVLIGPFATVKEAAYYWAFKHHSNEPNGMRFVGLYEEQHIQRVLDGDLDECDRRTMRKPSTVIMAKVRGLLAHE